MKMYSFNIIRILHSTIASVSHIANYISCRNNTPLLKLQGIWEVLAQMCIVIIAFSVKAANTDAPAAILVPAKGFYITGFYCDNWCAYLNERLKTFWAVIFSFHHPAADLCIFHFLYHDRRQ